MSDSKRILLGLLLWTTVVSALHLSLNFEDVAEQQRVWDRLAVGATITMPLGEPPEYRHRGVLAMTGLQVREIATGQLRALAELLLRQALRGSQCR